MIAGIGSIALCLVLVGSAVATRRRAGQPVARYALCAQRSSRSVLQSRWRWIVTPDDASA